MQAKINTFAVKKDKEDMFNKVKNLAGNAIARQKPLYDFFHY